MGTAMVQFKYAPSEGDVAMGLALMRLQQWIEFKLKTDKAVGGKQSWATMKTTNEQQLAALAKAPVPQPEAKKLEMAQRIVDQCKGG